MCYCGATDCPSCGVAQGYKVAYSPTLGYYNPEDFEMEFENDPRDWDWEAAVKEAKGNPQEPEDSFSEPYGSVYLGTVMSIMPSGKYWTCWACSNVTEKEELADEAYNDILNECAEAAGGWIESGLNGDLCDLFFCVPLDSDEVDDSMDGDHESALASAEFGTDEDYGGCDEGY